MNYEHHEGSQATKPLPVDTTSSSTVVYIRKNIRQIEREDSMSGDTVTLWSYDEAEITHEDYELILTNSITANEDATCELSENTENAIAQLEQAICDLSEEILGGE